MVFARAKILIHDYCLEEKPVVLRLNYTGPNPQLTVKKYVDLAKMVFKVRDSEIQEKIFSWDRTGKEERFEIEFQVRKDLDKYSYIFAEGGLSGSIRPSEEFGKEGNVSINIRAAVRAEYPQDTFWQRSIIYEFFRVLYHKLIYVGTWDKYMADCRDMLTMFINEMKAYLNILQRGGM